MQDQDADAGAVRFSVTLSELEDCARVAPEDQCAELAEAPNDPPVSRYDFDVTKLLGVTGAGYW